MTLIRYVSLELSACAKTHEDDETVSVYYS